MPTTNMPKLNDTPSNIPTNAISTDNVDAPPPPMNANSGFDGSSDKSNNSPVIISDGPKKKKTSKAFIATIFGLVLLVGGVAAGLVLTQQSQDIREKAAFGQPPLPVPSPVNGAYARLSCTRAKLDVVVTPTKTNYSYDATTKKWILNQTYQVINTTAAQCDDDDSAKCVLDSSNISLQVVKATCYCPLGTGDGSTNGACNLNCDINGDPALTPDLVGWNTPATIPDKYLITVGNSFNLTRAVDQDCGSFQTDVYIRSVNGDRLCKGSSQAVTVYHTNKDCTTPTTPPVATATPKVSAPPSTPPVACSALAFTLISASPTPAVTATPTATPTSTPRSCNNSCNENTDCSAGLVCSSGSCRNPSCNTMTDCICPTATPAPTATPKALVSCNNACTYNSDCSSGLVCFSGACRNPNCTSITNCTCPVAQPTNEPELPNAGASLPTILGVSAGIILLITSLALAL